MDIKIVCLTGYEINLSSYLGIDFKSKSISLLLLRLLLHGYTPANADYLTVPLLKMRSYHRI